MSTTTTTTTDYANLETPPKCTADFCLIPMATPSPSVSAHIAEIQRLIKHSGVKYTMHSAGTTLGSWTEVTALIGRAHALLHSQGIVRIQTDIRIGSRTDKTQSAADKVDAVNKLLAMDADVENTDAVEKSGVTDPEEVGAPLAS